ncbi:FAD binding domain-containing protein [Actinomadura sp. 6N118]|uniref:FAD binding domain-containing protein n=1 Tax=Actinomadura sp. 6N118 TaxID=3375151 RepID=UPI00378B78A2
MKPAAFAYHAPASLDAALELLTAEGTRPLAGGQSLMPLMHVRSVRPRALVDLGRVTGLDHIAVRDGTLVLGAMVRQRTLERDGVVNEHAPLLREAVRWVASAPVRNRGTLGGSVAQADPSGELFTALVALDATAVLRRAGGGERELAVAELPGATGGPPGDPDELLVELRVPSAPAGSRWAYVEINRRHNAPAVAGVAVGLELDGDGRVSRARLAMAGVEDRPRRLPEAEALLTGAAPGTEAIAAAAEAAVATAEPRADMHASAAYRGHALTVLIRRGVEAALGSDHESER